MLGRFLVALTAVLLLCAAARAQTTCPPYPVTLQNGTIADATEVMANLNAVMSCLNGQIALANARAPVGEIIMWPTANPPSGYLECDGAAVSRAIYSALFAVIGTSYGAGDGSTTFNLPDYRGMFLRGWAHGAGNDPDRSARTNRGDGTAGDAMGTRQDWATKDHQHSDLLASRASPREICNAASRRETMSAAARCNRRSG